ncbi:MAG: hypothetical protein GVY19_08705 [Bacteroidetes bacterium]|jgi:shikimate 5-dehydrogenase|nr:hypothetical protein [Bacteroidota bacterium]
MKTKRLILIVVITGAVAAAGIGYLMYNKPHTDIAATEPAYTIDAKSLVMDFNISNHKANEKYVNQVIQVNGTIVNIRQTQTSLWAISLYDEFQGVTCVMDSVYATENTDILSNLEEGEDIVVKGMCDGALTDVKLSRCVLPNKTY